MLEHKFTILTAAWSQGAYVGDGATSKTGGVAAGQHLAVELSGVAGDYYI